MKKEEKSKKHAFACFMWGFMFVAYSMFFVARLYVTTNVFNLIFRLHIVWFHVILAIEKSEEQFIQCPFQSQLALLWLYMTNAIRGYPLYGQIWWFSGWIISDGGRTDPCGSPAFKRHLIQVTSPVTALIELLCVKCNLDKARQISALVHTEVKVHFFINR